MQIPPPAGARYYCLSTADILPSRTPTHAGKDRAVHDEFIRRIRTAMTEEHWVSSVSSRVYTHE